VPMSFILHYPRTRGEHLSPKRSSHTHLLRRRRDALRRRERRREAAVTCDTNPFGIFNRILKCHKGFNRVLKCHQEFQKGPLKCFWGFNRVLETHRRRA
jgi:hypothetical protein